VARHTDEVAAAAWDLRMKHKHRSIGAIVKKLAAGGALRPGCSVAHVTDALWMITSPRSYRDLVVDRRWSHARFEKLLIDLASTFLVAEMA